MILVLLVRSPFTIDTSAVALMPPCTYNLAAVLLKALISRIWLCTPNYIHGIQPDRLLLALINVCNQYVQLSKRGALACWNALHSCIVYIIIDPFVCLSITTAAVPGMTEGVHARLLSPTPVLPCIKCYVAHCPLLQRLYLINMTFRQLAPVPSYSVDVSLHRQTDVFWLFKCAFAKQVRKVTTGFVMSGWLVVSMEQSHYNRTDFREISYLRFFY